jgi:PIN domain nuclease of toxin-antitoxin system
MRLLLDTHTFLWLVEGSPNLSEAAQAALTDPLNELFLSVASAWELAIKIGNGKLTLATRSTNSSANGRRPTSLSKSQY